MDKNLLINGGVLGTSQEGMLAIEWYLVGHYCFHRNVLNGKVEFSEKPNGHSRFAEQSAEERQEPQWKPLTHSTRIYLGRAMKALGYESTECSHVAHYKVIPLTAA